MAQTTQPATAPADLPRTWIDPDTGHRIYRLSDEPNSGAFYFNFNAFTADGREMVYTSPKGIHVLDLQTKQTRLVVPAPAHAIVVGKKTPSVFYTNPADNSLCVADLRTGQIRKLADMPKRGKVATVNADETLAAGTFIEGDGKDYGENAVKQPGLSGPNVQPVNKAQMMEDRLAAKLPMTLFTIDLRTGEVKHVFEHDTNWNNHLLFSPTDPTLLMYCHEGPWQKIDRIWTIRTDGSQKTLIHKRTMAMEIAGHEFWGQDGKTVWYDLQRPKGEDFILAAYNLETGLRRWYRLTRNEWSIHFNVNADASMICGDGGDKGQVAKAPDGKWIYLFKPELTNITGINEKDFVQPGNLRSEKLVNMASHNYKQEPNVHFTPGNKMVIFTATILGPSYVFGVEIEKAAPATQP
ncbi:MAG: oligogalacturonate lyase family protein [Tepidisphaeraceae bacterium]